jgi:hypothetical protein
MSKLSLIIKKFTGAQKYGAFNSRTLIIDATKLINIEDGCQ